MPTHSNPNLRQSFNEYVSPNASGSGTPDSSNVSIHSVPSHHYGQGPSYGISSTLPDLSAMMFPSEDPFAYPNQPMMEFDNFKREPMEMMSGSPAPQIYMQNPNPNHQGMYDDLEGQLFGPIPPYLAQGQQDYSMQQQQQQHPQQPQMNVMSMMNAPQMAFPPGMGPTFDGIFNGAETEDWGHMHQRFRPQ